MQYIDNLNFILQEGECYKFDQTFNTNFDYKIDFSKEALDEFLRCSNISVKLSVPDILTNLGVVKQEDNKIILTNAGILFFGKNPQKFIPEAYITAVKYSTPDRFSIIDHQEIKGSLINQIEQSMLFVLRNIANAANLSFSAISASFARREDIYDYPVVALREAIINAVTHRLC